MQSDRNLRPEFAKRVYDDVLPVFFLIEADADEGIGGALPRLLSWARLQCSFNVALALCQLSLFVVLFQSWLLGVNCLRLDSCVFKACCLDKFTDDASLCA